jgi:hypothetical protein
MDTTGMTFFFIPYYLQVIMRNCGVLLLVAVVQEEGRKRLSPRIKKQFQLDSVMN